MNAQGAPSFSSELRISPRPALLLVAATGIAVGTYGSMGPSEGALYRAGLLFALGSLGLAASLWLLESWRPAVGRWLIVAGLTLWLQWTSRLFALPGLLGLMGLPTALAVAMTGPRASLVAAAAQTAYLLAMRPAAGVGLPGAIVPLAAIWLTVGLMALVYEVVLKLAQWSWEHFAQAQALLEEARNRQAELKQALAELAHANQQLALMNEKIAAARLIAEEAQKTKADFVAKVSHEFRTPLNMIIGLIDLLVESPGVYGQALPAALYRDLGIVHRNSQHLSSMINDVLDLSQIEAGRLALHREEVNLGDLVTHALAVVRPLLEKKHLELAVDLPPDLPLIYCDRTRIRQVVLNLVSNAARLTETGGLAVAVTGDGPWVQVAVRDTGPGISAEDRARIFEPFYQGSDAAWRTPSGSGLGLSISRQFVEMHGGRMWVESEPGQGSTFFFRLPSSPLAQPIARPERWIAEGWVDRSPSGALPTAPPRGRAILCDAMGDLYPALQRYADDLEFIPTADLQEAAREMERSAAGMVLFSTPNLAELGPQAAAAAQQMPGTPIIGCSVPPHAVEPHTAGAVGYLLKPLLLDQLEEALDRLGLELQHVLVVEDDPEALDLLARMLRTYDPALAVATATGGLEALEALRRSPPDLMLLDVLLPDLDGRQVLACKAQEEAIRDIPVIVVSAQDPRDQPLDSQAIVAAIGSGVSLTKLLRCSRQLAALLLEPG